jgi:hypothetical protein
VTAEKRFSAKRKKYITQRYSNQLGSNAALDSRYGYIVLLPSKSSVSRPFLLGEPYHKNTLGVHTKLWLEDPGPGDLSASSASSERVSYRTESRRRALPQPEYAG